MQQIPNTELTIHSNLQNAYEIIDQKLFEYNKQCVPPTQSPEVIYKSFIIKDGDNVIAGIHADIYVWNILFIDVIFVDEKYRKNGLGSILLNKIEKEAIARGVTLAHLDTFDFQGRLFYEKNGYEVFGVLNDCPQGHKRFYMSKLLNNDMT